MSKITKKQLQESHNKLLNQFASLVRELKVNNVIDGSVCPTFTKKTEPKQLDRSIFNGLDEKWCSAAVNTDGKAYLHNMPKSMMYFNHSSYGWCSKDYGRHEMQLIGDGFDPSGFAIGFIEREYKPQLKQLDQCVFNGLDSKWKFAAVDGDGTLKAFTYEPKLSVTRTGFILLIGSTVDIGTGYDASNWQNSLIARDVAKESAKVDLSSELTGSDLCKAMLARGDKYVMCMTSSGVDIIDNLDCPLSSTCSFIGYLDNYSHAVPINNQGEPLTASEVDL